MEKKIHDKELGEITLRSNPRLKRYSLRISNGAIIASMPDGGSETLVLDFINKHRGKLLENLRKSHPQRPLLNEATEMQTNSFKLHIFHTERENVYMKLSQGILHIACPLDMEMESPASQGLLNGLLESALRHEAHRILPNRLSTLAEQHGFRYSAIRISNSKSRWGSCSTNGNINLSLSLMLLPDHLINYVLLHELCHTVEMNHGERFWNLMDKVTANQAKALRKELKGYQML
ncbi:MAG: M48 family metallopeptidase [Tannerellaceae bacterium]|jgi:predicted metal-dependent hydrolase|nr:M48 family metallopeptidase [Tannerellaceae bacterium]